MQRLKIYKLIIMTTKERTEAEVALVRSSIRIMLEGTKLNKHQIERIVEKTVVQLAMNILDEAK